MEELDSIVMYPSPGIGHLIPMVELSKLILTHNPKNTFSITILVPTPPPSSDTISKQITTANADYIAAASASTPAISFRHFPPPTAALSAAEGLSLEEATFELSRLNNPSVLEELSRTPNLRAFVIDMFCDAAFEEASLKLRVPTYYYLTSNASTVAFLLYMQTLHEKSTHGLTDRSLLNVPGLPASLSVSDVPPMVVDRTLKGYEAFLGLSAHAASSSGVVINTFDFLEERALSAIRAGLCVPEGNPTPPVFAVGPVFAAGIRTDEVRRREVVTWLDEQPRRSVVFLCFGSMGRFSAEQLREIGSGLERSGHRFLWVVRDPPEAGGGGGGGGDALSALPEGFLERTRETGLVVKDWAPQAEVLGHDSVGGFVTHCGWNSVLESICGGVPMVAWPLYAEQITNRAVMVAEEMGVALTVSESNSDGLVSSAELEERVRELMDSERGKEVRERVSVMRSRALEAMECGGSSRIALTKLTEIWKQNR